MAGDLKEFVDSAANGLSCHSHAMVGLVCLWLLLTFDTLTRRLPTFCERTTWKITDLKMTDQIAAVIKVASSHVVHALSSHTE